MFCPALGKSNETQPSSSSSIGPASPGRTFRRMWCRWKAPPWQC